MPTADLLPMIERELAWHNAFGSSDYINNEMRVCFGRRLGKVGLHMPAARGLLNQLDRSDHHAAYRTIGDTVVRKAIQHALLQLESGEAYGIPLTDCEVIFQIATKWLSDGNRENPMTAGMPRIDRIGPDSFHGWVWSDEHDDDIFGRTFRSMVFGNYKQLPCTLTADEIAHVQTGASLLSELLPDLARSALAHAHVVAFYPNSGEWRGRNSSSEFRISGTISFSRIWIRNPWWVAEHLLHESLHHKMYDFRHAHSFLNPDYIRPDAPKVCSLWNEPGKAHNWDVHRVLAAFHVYVHLGLFANQVELRSDSLSAAYGPPTEIVSKRTALDRAHYLGDELKEKCWAELGLAGQLFVDWLLNVLDYLDDDSPPAGSFIHLLLDRYLKEGRKVDYALKKLSEPHDDIVEQASRIAAHEISHMRNILTASGAKHELTRFENDIQTFQNDDIGHHFLQLRSIVSATVLRLSSDGYVIDRSHTPEATTRAVRAMIEASSTELGRSVLRS